MTDLEKIEKYFNWYCNQYHLEKSESYKTPGDGPNLYDLKINWKEYYPFYDKPGIYFIFAADKELLYIGKASLNNTIGARLGSYFMNDKDGKFTTRPSHTWSKPPCYIYAIKVEHPYETPSLEEYLIGELKPPANTVGSKQP